MFKNKTLFIILIVLIVLFFLWQKNTSSKSVSTLENKHSIPLEEIVSVLPQDGIPSINQPKFISQDKANSFLKDNEPGIALSLNDIKRFYPFQILVWHEIVNDVIKGKRVLVTYCPLCLSGIVFDPQVGSESVEFGTSGKLWNSNLLMYDRKTKSLWSQILGEAVVGEMTGAKLTILSSDIIKYGDFKKLYPGGEVLSRDTGAVRTYGVDPYGDYYFKPDIYFPVNKKDGRLDTKALILGIVVNNEAKAYDLEAVRKHNEVADSFAGKSFVIRLEKDSDTVRIYEKQTDGSLNRINPFFAYWFSWVAAHPETKLYK
ncbi:DUF3179 domain-containing protein [Candidatus Gottesmanbacteria bacterium]|nr:DUF3179 domain-containing protein [Candidatus Gottesmanbacteria bacterium]